MIKISQHGTDIKAEFHFSELSLNLANPCQVFVQISFEDKSQISTLVDFDPQTLTAKIDQSLALQLRLYRIEKPCLIKVGIKSKEKTKEAGEIHFNLHEAISSNLPSYVLPLEKCPVKSSLSFTFKTELAKPPNMLRLSNLAKDKAKEERVKREATPEEQALDYSAFETTPAPVIPVSPVKYLSQGKRESASNRSQQKSFQFDDEADKEEKQRMALKSEREIPADIKVTPVENSMSESENKKTPGFFVQINKDGQPKTEGPHKSSFTFEQNQKDLLSPRPLSEGNTEKENLAAPAFHQLIPYEEFRSWNNSLLNSELDNKNQDVGNFEGNVRNSTLPELLAEKAENNKPPLKYQMLDHYYNKQFRSDANQWQPKNFQLAQTQTQIAKVPIQDSVYSKLMVLPDSSEKIKTQPSKILESELVKNPGLVTFKEADQKANFFHSDFKANANFDKAQNNGPSKLPSNDFKGPPKKTALAFHRANTISDAKPLEFIRLQNQIIRMRAETENYKQFLKEKDEQIYYFQNENANLKTSFENVSRSLIEATNEKKSFKNEIEGLKKMLEANSKELLACQKKLGEKELELNELRKLLPAEFSQSKSPEIFSGKELDGESKKITEPFAFGKTQIDSITDQKSPNSAVFNFKDEKNNKFLEAKIKHFEENLNKENTEKISESGIKNGTKNAKSQKITEESFFSNKEVNQTDPQISENGAQLLKRSSTNDKTHENINILKNEDLGANISPIPKPDFLQSQIRRKDLHLSVNLANNYFKKQKLEILTSQQSSEINFEEEYIKRVGQIARLLTLIYNLDLPNSEKDKFINCFEP